MISKLQTAVHTFKWDSKWDAACRAENVSKPLIKR